MKIITSLIILSCLIGMLGIVAADTENLAGTKNIKVTGNDTYTRVALVEPAMNDNMTISHTVWNNRTHTEITAIGRILNRDYRKIWNNTADKKPDEIKLGDFMRQNGLNWTRGETKHGIFKIGWETQTLGDVIMTETVSVRYVLPGKAKLPNGAIYTQEEFTNTKFGVGPKQKT